GALPSGALPFFAIAPCRLVDTRGAGSPWVGDWGPPALIASTARTFAIPAGPCPGIPSNAAAYSLNFTVLGEPGVYQNAFLTAWPTGSEMPTVSTLNFSGGQLFINAAVVPAGTGGAIDVLVAAGAHLILDVNGYYAPLSAVTSLTSGATTLTGAVTLAQGSNVTITPSGQTFTLAAGPLVSSVEGLTGAVDVVASHGATVSAGSGTLAIGTNGTSSNTASTLVARNAAGGFGAGTIDLAGSPYLLSAGGVRLLHWTGSETTNLFLGPEAGGASSTAQMSTAFGTSALRGLTTGSANTAFGFESLAANTSATYNTAVGASSLRDNTTSSGNTAVGFAALQVQSFANGDAVYYSYNTAVGQQALQSNQPTNASNGEKNVAVGYNSLRANTTGSSNTAIGTSAMAYNTTASWNTAVGVDAMRDNEIGDLNVAVGAWALGSNTTAGRNTALGTAALLLQSFSNGDVKWTADNTAVGFQALRANQPTTTSTGIRNTGVGASVLEANTTGRDNTAVGRSALVANTSGGDNTALGESSLAGNVAGSGNTAVGSGSLGGTSASYNTAVGAESLFLNQTGTANVALGYRAGYNETGSHKLHIANSDSKTLIWGDFVANRVAVNNTAATDTLDVNGTLRVRTFNTGSTSVCRDANGVLASCSSDARLKTDVRDLREDVDVLAALEGLRGVTFRWDPEQERARDLGDRREIGLIAQEVEEVLPWVVTADAEGLRSLDYPRLTAFLVEVAKRQQEQIREQERRFEAQGGLLRDLLERLKALERQLAGGPTPDIRP
ncbi:MAG: hypothetical protein DYH06_13940, partial [Acidobacteria bacterium ACB2]|nr:hypothetical protein [Acidobacteria bacterium ACB2]